MVVTPNKNKRMKITKIAQKGILLFCLLLSITSFSANDKIMKYLKGSNIGNQLNVANSLTIIDQKFAGYYVPFVLPRTQEAYVTAVLRYEESSFLTFPIVGDASSADHFKLVITYNIELTDKNRNQTTKTGQVLLIDYDAEDNYKDIAVKRYKGYLEGKMTITNITFDDGDGNNYNYTDIPDDVYLELTSDVERYYELQTSIPLNTAHNNDNIISKNELEITWDYVLGAESFDVEWVFVDVSDIDAALLNTIQTSTLTYDWKNATRINTANNYYNISMAYPSGMLIYRIRPVGVDLTYNFPYLRVNGLWSENTVNATINAAYTAGNGFAFNGLEGTKNWTYNVAYAEDGKRKEGISYFDGSARSRQEVTILNSDQNAIVGETMYDFEGRPAVSILPTPVTSKGIGFYESIDGTTVIPFNGGYSKNDFDTDDNHTAIINNPIGPNPMSSLSLANTYYSANNTSNSLFKGMIPDALNIPFSRTIYKTDGTDRITEQSGVGPELMHGTANTTKYYYGSPSDMEIERLFGNEVGPVSFYQKNMVKDPNGQVSIQYLDKEGRTIATSLAGNVSPESPLLDIDYKPAPVNIHTNLLINNMVTTEASVANHVLTISTQNTTVAFQYTVDEINYTSCLIGSLDNVFECVYDLDIKVIDEDGVDLLTQPQATPMVAISTPIISTSPTPGTQTFQFTVTFDEIGTYTISKQLVINNTKRQEYINYYRNALLADSVDLDNLTNTCLNYNPPAPENCLIECEDFCVEAYRDVFVDENQNTVTVYYDDEGLELADEFDQNGDLIPIPTAYQILVDNCSDECREVNNGAVLPESLSECELKLQAMKWQLSPRGQYFDNLKQKYQDLDNDGLLDLDGNGNPIVNSTTANPASTFNYDINGWLTSPNGANLSVPPSAIFGTVYNNWDSIRLHWNDAPWTTLLTTDDNLNWLDNFVATYHPEYCAYQYNCLTNIAAECASIRSYLLDYDQYMMSGSEMLDSEKSKDIGAAPDPIVINAYMDFLNPLGMDNVLFPAKDYINEVAYPNTGTFDDPETTNNPRYFVDPLFKCSRGLPLFFKYENPNILGTYIDVLDAKKWMKDRLQQFINVSTTQTPIYHSIWYVMDDPLNIHLLANPPSGISQDAFNFYNAIHGNSVVIPAVIGVLDNGTHANSLDLTKQNKYQYFRSTYKFYRDFILYHLFKEGYHCDKKKYDYWNPDVLTYLPSPADPIDYLSYNVTRDHDDLSTTSYNENDGFELVWPRNMVFDMFDPSIPNGMITLINTTAQQACKADCEANALAWMNQYETCTNTANLNQIQLDSLRADLIHVCQIPCNAATVPDDGYVGSSDGDNGVNYIWADDGTTKLHNFDEVIDYYTNSVCTETVIYPNQVINTVGVSNNCNCDNFEAYISNTTANGGLNLSWPINPNDSTTIKNAVNALAGSAGNYMWADISSWRNYCNNTIGDIIDFPPTLECIDCKCENLAFFIESRYPYDPYTLDLTKAIEIAGDIESEFGTVGMPVLTGQEVYYMMNQCAAGIGGIQLNEVENDDFANLPNIFRCNANSEITSPEDDCADELDNDNLNNYLNTWNYDLQQLINEFYDAYTARCMFEMDVFGQNKRETFTADYELNEFMYTLYYYDQAGNLIKTVPPEGVKPNATGTGSYPNFTPDPFYTAVADYRLSPYDVDKTPGGNPHQNVDHTLVTQYKYDSYNNLIWQSTPDGGITNFWYDKLGRLVLSQNAKQLALANNTFSYTLYDELGRIYEVGEINGIDLTLYVDVYSSNTNPTNSFLGQVESTNNRKEVTSTYYDEAINITIEGYFLNQKQEELRTRVATITREENFDGFDNTYDYGTHFSYDIHGNVKEVIQENNDFRIPALITTKRITYNYDLISGNVNKVSYQPTKSDQFYHRYCYDADNRITKVETSRDNYIWDTDAKYFYYEHGPLARCEIGEKQVAGSDFAYTLQGWLKGVNSNTLKTSRDIGKDANLTSGNLNQKFATDAYGYSLGYFQNDYKAILPPVSTTDNFLASISTDPINSSSQFQQASPSLYNGNISRMVTVMLDQNEVAQNAHGVAYRYDQVNRIRNSNVFTATDVVSANSFQAAGDDGRYRTEYHYDLNGNITNLKRSGVTVPDITDPSSAYGPGVGIFDMDDMNYYYNNQGNNQNSNPPTTHLYGNNTSLVKNSNQLMQVTDNLSLTGNYTTDIDNQGAPASNDYINNNYSYDPIGQLTKDVNENITNIVWDVYNKIKEIQYSDPDNLSRANIAFKYDASGNRIAKILKTKDATGTIDPANDWEYYYYQRDASGNTMAVYKQEISSVAGVNNWLATSTLIERDIYGSSRLGTDNTKRTFLTYFSANFGTSPITQLPSDLNLNFVGAVIVNSGDPITVSEPKSEQLNLEIGALTTDVILDFNGDYHLNSGTLTPIEGSTTVLLNANSNINVVVYGNSITIDTKNNGAYINNINGIALNFLSPVPVILEPLDIDINNYSRKIGDKVYEKSNHLGNVLVTLSDRKIAVDSDANETLDAYEPDVLSYSDYYPFGSPMPNRHTVQTSSDIDQNGNKVYRYGFNGMESDFEVNNTTKSSYTATFWQYDSRLGRRWNTDPKPNPSISNYATFANNPISYVDMLGDTPTVAEAAMMQDFTYNLHEGFTGGITGSSLGGWEATYMVSDKESGFKSALFSRSLGDGTKEYAYVFAGTDDMGDVKTDALMLLLPVKQMGFALSNAEMFSKRTKGSELTFVGHSLGGWLANGAAMKTGNPAITFNGAGITKINSFTYDLDKDPVIKAYVVQGEILNASLGIVKVKSTGKITLLKAEYSYGFFTKAYESGMNHTIGVVINLLKEQGYWKYRGQVSPIFKKPIFDLYIAEPDALNLKH